MVNLSDFYLSEMEDFMTAYSENVHIFEGGKSNTAASAKERDVVAEN